MAAESVPTRFTALRWPLGLDAALGAVAREDDYARHVEQLMRQVLLTDPGERVNRPDFGCGVRRMLFAPNDPAGAALARVTVAEALRRWLGPVIEVDDVAVQAVEDRVEITVAYTLRASGERRYLNEQTGL
ncbi:GPW/gp25 family protein [Streptomyces sp. NPDC057301]|uniref:GPW/gp25 family protein n=1 Tax=Streptomyces sp. NPDC057301 TaxID=3346093 RepID=UPI003634E644